MIDDKEYNYNNNTTTVVFKPTTTRTQKMYIKIDGHTCVRSKKIKNKKMNYDDTYNTRTSDT